MKIFTSGQIREIDGFTIKNEPISSLDLMERAALQLFGWITGRFGRAEHFVVFTGPGNNGGDGLALARMLYLNEYQVDVYYVNFSEKKSADWEANFLRLKNETDIELRYIDSVDQSPVTDIEDIIIDAIFGSGLTRNVTGLAGEIIRKINDSERKKIISIDIPSGLFCEDNGKNDSENIIKADYTLSFQFPKLSFMFADNERFTGDWSVLPIGLHKAAIAAIQTDYSYTEISDIIPLVRTRNKFDHKGKFGHSLLISGSIGKIGATVLGAGGALHTGTGLLTCHIPGCGNIILQSSVPEAMVSLDQEDNYIGGLPDMSNYSAVGIGPGLGVHEKTAEVLHGLLSSVEKPLVIDADALNILSKNKQWLDILPEGTVLTPHVREFERLAGSSRSCYDRLIQQVAFSQKHRCVVVLKGAYTSITSADGRVRFNSTGNPGMATGGSGDVLTGIILSLLAQGYEPDDAALFGVYLHGMAGDIAARKYSPESLIASDIINSIGEAYLKIRERVL